MTDREDGDQSMRRLHDRLHTLQASITTIESRLDLFHKEFQRVAATVARAQLGTQHARAAAGRREAALDDIKSRLEAIQKAMATD